MKQLYLDRKNRKISGLCAGIAKYFDLDPSIVRLALLLITMFTAFVPGIMFYVIATLIIPAEGN